MLTLYTRRDCHLCDEAKNALRGVVQVREVDVDEDPELQRRFTNDVPVGFMDGVEVFRHRVGPEFLKTRRAAMSKGDTLAREKCVPCRGGVPPLKGEELRALERELSEGWRVVDEHHLEKSFAFPDFATALAFTNSVGAIAEEAGHHPDIYLAWGKVRITIWTHKIDGLTRSDFVLAAKIDRV